MKWKKIDVSQKLQQICKKGLVYKANFDGKNATIATKIAALENHLAKS